MIWRENPDSLIRDKVYTADDETPKCGLCNHFCDDYDCSKHCGAEHAWNGYERTENSQEEQDGD